MLAKDPCTRRSIAITLPPIEMLLRRYVHQPLLIRTRETRL